MSKKTRERRAKRDAKRANEEQRAHERITPEMREVERIYKETEFEDVIGTMLSLVPGTLIHWTEKGRPEDVGALMYPTFDDSLPTIDMSQVVSIHDWPVVETRLLLVKKDYLRTLVGREIYDLSCAVQKTLINDDRFPMFGCWCEQFAPLIAAGESYEAFGGFNVDWKYYE
jgi:hypothetical protein